MGKVPVLQSAKKLTVPSVQNGDVLRQSFLVRNVMTLWNIMLHGCGHKLSLTAPKNISIYLSRAFCALR